MVQNLGVLPRLFCNRFTPRDCLMLSNRSAQGFYSVAHYSQ